MYSVFSKKRPSLWSLKKGLHPQLQLKRGISTRIILNMPEFISRGGQVTPPPYAYGMDLGCTICIGLPEVEKTVSLFFRLRLSIKDVRSQWGLSSADILRTKRKGGRGSSNADLRIIWCKKLSLFWNLWCVRIDKGWRVEPMRTFYGQGERINFLRFWADVFHGRPLSSLKISEIFFSFSKT